MKNRVEDLRNILFAQLEKLSDCDEKDLEDECNRASSMCDIAQSIIDSAKAQTDFLRTLGSTGAKEIDFFNKQNKQLADAK